MQTAAAGGVRDRAGRGWAVLVWLSALVLLISHDFGRMTFDTKLGVNIDPVGFYERLWHLWNPFQWFGGLHNQYIGYAFPMGLFYLVGHLLHIPVWIVQRLWMASLVTVAFWGIVRLTEALGVGSRPSRLLAGGVFALWPTFTTLVGSSSAAVVPGVMAPWVLLQLVDTGRPRSERVRAARSGFFVLCMGGVNAVSTLASLLLPGMYVLTRPRHRRWRLAAWWSLAVTLASLWWLIPLLYMGRYGFDFLPYIEQARNTTQSMSAAAVLRGSGNWVAYLGMGQPWVPSGWLLTGSAWAVLAGAVAAAGGLAGLAHRDMPERAWLRPAAMVAALITLAGYWGPLGGPFHATVHELLDGMLAPIRNVYKFEPVLAAVMALGLAHLLSRVRVLSRVRPLSGGRPPRAGRRTAVAVAAAVVACVLAGLGQPYLTGDVLQAGSFKKVPDHWQQTADFLERNSPTGTAMVVPANSHGLYVWGKPNDEPLEPLADSPWAQRDLVPFSGGGVRDLTDGVEQAIQSGAPAPGLPAYLARAGVRYLVVRNDLDPGQFDYVSPQLVHRTLESSGFVRAAAFGPKLLDGVFGRGGTSPELEFVMPAYPAVEIYQAADPALRGGQPATVLPASDAAVLGGGPAALLQLADQGVLGRGPIVPGREAPAVPATSYVTDGLRRTDTRFGLVSHNKSYTYTPDETIPPDDPQGDGGLPPRQLPPSSAGEPQRGRPRAAPHQTVAVLSGASSVRASSYGSWLWAMPQADPVNAFDGNPRTSWVEGRSDTPVGQWNQITFDRVHDLAGPLRVRLLVDGTARPVARRLVVTTERGSAATDTRPTEAAQPLNVPAGPTRWLRVTIGAADGGAAGGPGAGISEVEIPGVRVSRYLQPAQDPAGRNAPEQTFSFHRDPGTPFGMPAGEPALNRTFTTDRPLDSRLSAAAVAVPGDGLDRLMGELANAQRESASTVRVSADSTFGQVPSLRPQNLLDGNPATGWIAARSTATLQLRWKGARRIDRIRLSSASGIAAAPTEVRITGAGGSREVPVPSNGELRFAPLVTDHLDVTFTKVKPLTSYNAMLGAPQQLPVGLAEIRVPALGGMTAASIAPGTRFRLPCGQGPPITLDGHRYATTAEGTVEDLTAFRPVTVRLCTAGKTSGEDSGKTEGKPASDQRTLPAGRHWLTSPGDGPLAVTDLTLRATAGSASPPPQSQSQSSSASGAAAARTLRVGSWDMENRTVTVGPGAASYLAVHQAFNPGWTATLNGVRLKPVTLDGWQQGYVLPAGAGGTVRLSFAPAAGYHLTLGVAAGAVGFLLLLTIAVRPPKRRGLGLAWEVPRGASAAWAWVGVLAVTALVTVVGGVLALAVPVVALLARWSPMAVPWLAGAAMTAAGVFAAAGVHHGVVHGTGAFGAPAHAAALIALAAALTPSAGRRR